MPTLLIFHIIQHVLVFNSQFFGITMFVFPGQRQEPDKVAGYRPEVSVH